MKIVKTPKEKKKKTKKIKVETPERIIKDLEFPITFTVEGSGLSVNHLYGRFRNRTFLKPEGKQFKMNSIISICKQLGFEYIIDDKAKEVTVIHCIKEQKYSVEYKVYGRWLTKTLNTLKSDVSNRAKLVEDSVSAAVNCDDKHFWKVSLEKIHSEDERFEITINKM